MPTLMRRKLIAMGDGGLVITVPKAWRDYYRLKAGDLVTVIADDELRIRPMINKEKMTHSEVHLNHE